ncbi:MAG: CHAT domain-containing protein [Acidobacteria bacterium]|nr:CHAT domain-containing protein [Acidobacteriota bacterium]
MANAPIPHVQAPMKLRGFREAFPAESGLKSKFVTVRAEFRTDRARAVQQAETFSVKSDDVVEIEFADGPRLWLRGDDYRQQFGGAPARDVTGEEIHAVPDSLDLLPRGMQSRGPVKWVVKSLKVLGVDLEQKAAVQIGKLVDGRASTNRPGLGLYRCSMESGKFGLTSVAGGKLPSDQPCLVFIHGTASSTWGSFGGLWSAARSRELEVLRRFYGDRVFAFEHATLSRSPIENALELARLLPANAKLHIVSHSRGGLVGELLCRANRVETLRKTRKGTGEREQSSEVPRPFTPQELQLFEGDDVHQASLKGLQDLEVALKEKQFQVDRFVRVACPALGTTLASGRLDRWLSIIGSVANAMPDTPLFDAFKDIGDFAAAVIKERTDPTALPGLEAMMPESALIKLVNWPTTTIPGQLTVIAGDIEPDAWWAKLLVFGTDRFYDGDHDLVVNTASMYGGAKRESAALASFHKGPGVNHFSYFSNNESAKQLVRALTRAADDQAGFELLEKPAVDIARAVVARSAEPRPVVFVLPGIMGSELSAGRDDVWAKIADLVFGGLRKLRIDAKNVKPTQPIARYYGELIEFLANTHKVIPFAYDWRLPVEQEADRLAQEVRREFEQARQHNQPVRVLAHSMGGLVARTLIARHSALWREICGHPSARLLMLGTPNGGSHSITELLVGSSSTLRKLALIDIRHSQQELLEIISRFPGVLAMLPKDAREDYFSPQTWRSYHERAGAGWILPQDQDLAQAHSFRQLLDRTPLDPSSTVYVAGCADVTLASMTFNAEAKRSDERIQFMATVRGDGRVTWDSGIPSGVPAWYMDVEHGDLPAHPAAFPALLQLLQSGSTTLLPQTPPVSRAAAELFPLPRAVDELYPNAEELAASALGAGRRRRKTAKAPEAPVRVSIVHGNLAFARYPVAVGHYAGDTIISAEGHLDRALDGELSRRHELGLYPGALGTSAIFTNPKLHLDPPPSPQGAIVIGLGTPGSLNSGTLSRAFSRAMLEYVIEWSNQQRIRQGSRGKEPSTELGLTTLLIGTGAGGVNVPDSVHATLQSVVRTNQALAGARQPQRIREVEFIELWEDRAIQAVKSCQGVESDPELQGLFVIPSELVSKKGGLRRLSFVDPGGWWHRVQILGGGSDDSAYCTLRFTATTRRARNEVRLLPTQRALVDRFVEEAIRTTQDDRSVSRTLFEMLLPNELKEQAPDQDDIVLMLDEEAARYPWELLEDPGGSGRNPFVIEHGVLRQLETLQFRESVRPVLEKNALVIGDPISPFVELKGAQAEADAVSRSLQADGRFHVETRKRPEGEEVMQALCAMPYRVLHLAGHGVYNHLPPWAAQCGECGQELADAESTKRTRAVKPVTGMIIGDGIYLTPAEIRQMRRVPELVFINCCHLGRIEGASEKALNQPRDQNLIAANVATEFIRMGVHAVVAAGWAVDDGAALTFATAFYDRMLQGAPFGRAVKEARTATFERHAQTSTWGAYQCYGDPDYHLVRKSEAGSVTRKEVSFVSRAEAIVDIGNLAARLSTKAGEDQQEEREWLKATLSALEEKKWLENGRICTALAQVYSEAELFDDAIGYFRAAMAVDPSVITLKDIEQLANLLGRRAVAKGVEVPASEKPMRSKASKARVGGSVADIDEAIRLLEWLMETPPWRTRDGEKEKDTSAAGLKKQETTGKTVERYSLLGSAYKRKAWISKDPRVALRKMKKAYKDACSLSEKAGKSAPYPRLNQLFAEVILSWEGKKGRQPAPNLRLPLENLQTELVNRSLAKESFWDEVMLPDCELALALLGGALTSQTIEALTGRYREVRRRASRGEFASVLDQIEFLETMATRMGKKEIAKSLDLLKRQLELKPEKTQEKPSGKESARSRSSVEATYS